MVSIFRSLKPATLLDEIPERGGRSLERAVWLRFHLGNVGLVGDVSGAGAHRSFLRENVFGRGLWCVLREWRAVAEG